MKKASGIGLRILVAASFSCAVFAGQQPQITSDNPKAPLKIRVSPGIAQGLVLKTVLPDASDLKSVKNSDVKVVFEINQSGMVDAANGAEGDPGLFERSIKAIQEWKFKPYVLNGQPIFVESFVYFHFNKGKASIKFQR